MRKIFCIFIMSFFCILLCSCGNQNVAEEQLGVYKGDKLIAQIGMQRTDVTEMISDDDVKLYCDDNLKIDTIEIKTPDYTDCYGLKVGDEIKKVLKKYDSVAIYDDSYVVVYDENENIISVKKDSDGKYPTPQNTKYMKIFYSDENSKSKISNIRIFILDSETLNDLQ